MVIQNALVFDESLGFVRRDVFISGQWISDSDDGNTVDAAGLYAIPGLTDVHFHGCAGYDLCDASEDAIKGIAEYQLRNGVTQICPAAMSLPVPNLMDVMRIAANHRHEGSASLIGINLEGPFLSHKKRGAHCAAYLRPPDADLFCRLNEMSGGVIKLVTLAPELGGAMDFIKKIKRFSTVSLGHTQADYDTARRAFAHGARHVTHLFNAMPPLLHREPGVIGAALDAGAMVELITDGLHVAPSAVRAAFKMFGDRIIIISDSMRAAGMPDGEYALGGATVYKRDGAARLSDGRLAGSVLNLMECMRAAVAMGVPLDRAVKSATINPCRAVGADKICGTIEKGKLANIILLDCELKIRKILFKGVFIFESPA